MASRELLKEHHDFQEELKGFWGNKATPKELNEQIKKVEKELAKIDRQRKKMASLLMEDGIESSDFVSFKEELNFKETQLRKELESWLAYARESETRLASLEELLQILKITPLHEMWAEATDDERRWILEDFIKAIVLHDEYIEIQYYDAPPFKVFWDEVKGRNVCIKVERVMGLEPTTFSLGS